LFLIIDEYIFFTFLPISYLNPVALILPNAGASCIIHKNIKHHAPCWYASRRTNLRAIAATVSFRSSLPFRKAPLQFVLQRPVGSFSAYFPQASLPNFLSVHGTLSPARESYAHNTTTIKKKNNIIELIKTRVTFPFS